MTGTYFWFSLIIALIIYALTEYAIRRDRREFDEWKERKIICLGKVGLLTFALISGAIYAYSVNHINTTEKCEINHTFGRTFKLLRGELDSEV